MAKIPSRLEDLLPMAAFERVLDALNRPEIAQKVREAASKVGLKEVNPLEQVQAAWQQARSWLESISVRGDSSGSPLINATGSLFPGETNRLPMASSTSLSLAQSAVGFHDLSICKRRSTDIVQRCLGTNAHAWLSEPALAILAAVRSLGASGVLIARSDTVRIPGFGEVRSMLSSLGIPVQEVGPSNGASVSDWSAALEKSSDWAILSLRPNGLPLELADSQRKQLIELAGSSKAYVIDFLVDGSVDERLSTLFGFPSVGQALRHPQHLVMLPTHFLLGGTKGVLCLAQEQVIERLESTANLLGAELDCAAINANLMALQIASIEEVFDHGLIGALTINPENLRSRSVRLATQISGVGPVANAVVVDSQHPLGPSPWDRYLLANAIIELEVEGAADVILSNLCAVTGNHPSILIGRRGDRSVIDLRFVDPAEDHRIVAAFRDLQS
jgi:L-seryl-tRNA(Ser) seleniumtransferase